ncbi:MAG: CyaY protein [Enterobacterales bacterium]|jgi:CyaY protein
MEESKFNQYIDETLLAIEEAIDDMSLDIDYDTIAGILTLEFANQTKIIINRQSANSQLWVAARSGGFHLDFIEEQWFCKKEHCNLQKLLDRLFSDQAQTEIQLNLELLF